jgi:hypothetical protein
MHQALQLLFLPASIRWVTPTDKVNKLWIFKMSFMEGKQRNCQWKRREFILTYQWCLRQENQAP